MYLMNITLEHMLALTKWMPFCRLHLYIFSERKYLYFEKKISEICSSWPGLGNGLAPNRLQAVTWTNGD